MDDKATRQAAIDLLSKLKELDLSKAKMVSISVVMNNKHKMPDGSMMKDSEMEEESSEYCSDCGEKDCKCS